MTKTQFIFIGTLLCVSSPLWAKVTLQDALNDQKYYSQQLEGIPIPNSVMIKDWEDNGRVPNEDDNFKNFKLIWSGNSTSVPIAGKDGNYICILNYSGSNATSNITLINRTYTHGTSGVQSNSAAGCRYSNGKIEVYSKYGSPNLTHIYYQAIE
ncbi:hypothetical protein ACSWVZ_003212 [Photobacterium damselae]